MRNKYQLFFIVVFLLSLVGMQGQYLEAGWPIEKNQKIIKRYQVDPKVILNPDLYQRMRNTQERREQCTESGGNWNSRELFCECPDDMMAIPASLDFGSDQSPGTICAPLCTQEGQILTGQPPHLECVCNEDGFYRQSTRQSTYDDGSPRCEKRIVDLKIRFQTGTISDSGTGAGFFIWLGEEDLPRDIDESEPLPNYLVLHIDDGGPLTLDGGDVDRVHLGEEQGGVMVLSSGASLSDFLSGDVHFLGIYPDRDYGCNLEFFEGFTGFDGWYLAQLKVQIKLEGESSFRTVYNNTSVNDWIDYSHDSCLRGMQPSKHVF